MKNKKRPAVQARKKIERNFLMAMTIMYHAYLKNRLSKT